MEEITTQRLQAIAIKPLTEQSIEIDVFKMNE
jgi:hypothetical protein